MQLIMDGVFPEDVLSLKVDDFIVDMSSQIFEEFKSICCDEGLSDETKKNNLRCLFVCKARNIRQLEENDNISSNLCFKLLHEKAVLFTTVHKVRQDQAKVIDVGEKLQEICRAYQLKIKAAEEEHERIFSSSEKGIDELSNKFHRFYI